MSKKKKQLNIKYGALWDDFLFESPPDDVYKNQLNLLDQQKEELEKDDNLS